MTHKVCDMRTKTHNINQYINAEGSLLYLKNIELFKSLLILSDRPVSSALTVAFTCGDALAWWNRKVIETLALHVTGTCAHDI